MLSMRIVTCEDAIELLGTLTRPSITARIRHMADIYWMREAVDLPWATLHVHGLWSRPGPGEPLPMLVVHVVRQATREAPENKGAAVFQATPDGQIVMQCLPELELGAYMGDPNAEPSILNGDFPWLYAPAAEEAVEAGLRDLASGSTSRSLALA